MADRTENWSLTSTLGENEYHLRMRSPFCFRCNNFCAKLEPATHLGRTKDIDYMNVYFRLEVQYIFESERGVMFDNDFAFTDA